MLKSVVTAAVLGAALVVGHHAEARSWWLVDFSKNRCVSAPITPEGFEIMARNASDLEGPPDITIKRDENGEIAVVGITTTYSGDHHQVNMVWGTTFAECEGVRQYLVSKGAITDPNDLR